MSGCVLKEYKSMPTYLDTFWVWADLKAKFEEVRYESASQMRSRLVKVNILGDRSWIQLQHSRTLGGG